MIYLITILFTLSFVFYSKYQFNDEKAGWNLAAGKWHPFGLAMRVLFFAALLVFRYFPFDVWDLFLCAVINMILFDVGINIIALHVTWNYSGETSKIDKRFGNIKWYTYAAMLIGAVITKYFKSKNK